MPEGDRGAAVSVEKYRPFRPAFPINPSKGITAQTGGYVDSPAFVAFGEEIFVSAADITGLDLNQFAYPNTGSGHIANCKII